ncbi:MAG: glycosyltransferase family 4 protein [Lentisphaerae bacterium]|nr:glycosyltransferase family 4 protein [Lentisphaerota bacterium]
MTRRIPWRRLPVMLAALPCAGVLLAWNALVLAVLKRPGVIRRRRVADTRTAGAGEIVFAWAELPDAVFDYRVGGEISHIIGFLGGVRELARPLLMISTRPIRHRDFAAEQRVVTEAWLPPWPGEVRQMAYNWKVLLRTWGRIRARRPALVYHRASAFSFIGVLLSVAHRIPLVVEVNTLEAWEHRQWGGARFARLLALTERINLAYAVRIAVVSRVLKDTLVRDGVPAERILVNPNGVNPEVFRPGCAAAGLRERYGLGAGPYVGFIGSFAPYHGVLTLGRAVRRVCDAVPQARFLLMGDGPLRPELERILRADGTAGAVTLTGKVPHEDVPGLLDACVVLASPHQNMGDGSAFFGSPTKVFEYMAMGKGIAASRIGQLEDILEDGRDALLVPPEDPDALADALIRLLRDEALRHRLGRSARARALDGFTWVHNARRALDLAVRPFGLDRREATRHNRGDSA